MVSITDAIKTAVKIKPDFILVLHGLHTNFKHIIPMLKRFGFTVGIWLTDDPYYSILHNILYRIMTMFYARFWGY